MEFNKKTDEKIQIMVEIAEDQKRLTRDQLEVKYKDFAEANPKTWLHLMDRNIDLQQLMYYHRSYKINYSKAKGNHRQRKFAADIKLGEKIADKYIYPKIGKPEPEQMAKAYAMAKIKSENPDTKPAKKEDMKKIDL